MGSLEQKEQIMFDNIYKNKKILVTGHTGFKGSWLCLWLELLGANVIGYSPDIPTKPSLFSLVKPKCIDIRGDIRDFKKLNSVVKEYKPEIIFHLAAQPLVRTSYKQTLETYQTNVIGTANILETIKHNKCVKAVVLVTTDKVYLNNETGKAFKETDSLCGYDPYSASKAACEIVISSYRDSFFNVKEMADVTTYVRESNLYAEEVNEKMIHIFYIDYLLLKLKCC